MELCSGSLKIMNLSKQFSANWGRINNLSHTGIIKHMCYFSVRNNCEEGGDSKYMWKLLFTLFSRPPPPLQHSSFILLSQCLGQVEFAFSTASLVGVQMVKNLPATQETGVQSLGREDLLVATATHSSICIWRIPWTEEPGGLLSMDLQRVEHGWMTNTFTSPLSKGRKGRKRWKKMRFKKRLRKEVEERMRKE